MNQPNGVQQKNYCSMRINNLTLLKITMYLAGGKNKNVYKEVKLGRFWLHVDFNACWHKYINCTSKKKYSNRYLRSKQTQLKWMDQCKCYINFHSLLLHSLFTKQWICLCLFRYSSNILWARTSRIHCQCCFTLRFTKDSSSVQGWEAVYSRAMLLRCLTEFFTKTKQFWFSELPKFHLCCLPLEMRRE